MVGVVSAVKFKIWAVCSGDAFYCYFKVFCSRFRKESSVWKELEEESPELTWQGSTFEFVFALFCSRFMLSCLEPAQHVGKMLAIAV